MSEEILLILLLLAAGSIASVRATQPITTGKLVREMVDLHRLAGFPGPEFKTVQFSSYDRRSDLPGGPGWFANNDGFGNEPIPNFEAVLAEPNKDGIGDYLICDVEGPGAIVRVWTAAISGDIRMYLDGADEPIFDGPAAEFLSRPYRRFAEAAGIDEAVLAGSYQQRDSCYLPIPFAGRCRIVWIGDLKQIHFYHIQIRLYEPGTKVVTFRPEDLKTYETDIRAVGEMLRNPQARWKYSPTLEPIAINAEISPGKEEEILSIDGPKAIERLTLKISAKDIDRALRQTVMRIIFDDYPWGQVQSPVGDFFGAAPGINPYDSVPFIVGPDGDMTCRFVMPFERSCRIVLENRGTQEVSVTGSALPVEYKWNEGSMHFRARWRVDHDVLADTGDGAQDMPYLIANGTGVYVGTALYLLNPNPIPTPHGSWWGEGDEKVFIDDDTRPSTFGTGSEDYFNYGWSSPDIFTHAYCGQPRNDGPGNRGFVTNNRWHVLDCLPFKQRLSFYIELLSHERTPGMSYARIGYHYGRPGMIDDHVLITNEDVRHLEVPRYEPAARIGSAGQTFYQAEHVVEIGPKTSLVKSNQWARGQLLVWHPEKKGDELSFRIPVKEAGRYEFRFTAARTPTSGRFSVTIDGKKLRLRRGRGVVDLYDPYRTLSRVVPAGEIKLEKGDKRMTIRYEGASHDSGEVTIGIDYIWVKKIERRSR